MYEPPTAALAALAASKAYPVLYDRIRITVSLQDGKRFENTWTYALTSPNGACHPPPEYRAELVRLAREHGFPGDYVRQLEQ